jgi:DNA-binding NarL/FixJ family response regulator
MLSIVIADDHEVMRRGMRAVLEAREGWIVSGEAGDGRQAVAEVCATRPRVAVVDLGLPELGGIEVTRQVRKLAPETEVVICTLREEESLARDALCAGARAFVLKSAGAAPLADAVAAAAEGAGFYSTRYTPAALGCPCGPGARPVRSGLTPREAEIAQLLAEGKTNFCVSVILGISVRTVETHRMKIMQKLHLESNVELVHWAIRNGLIEP